MEEAKNKTVKPPQYFINTDEEVEMDEEELEDLNTTEIEIRNKKNDQLLKFEKCRKMNGGFRRYTDEVKKIQIEPTDITITQVEDNNCIKQKSLCTEYACTINFYNSFHCSRWE